MPILRSFFTSFRALSGLRNFALKDLLKSLPVKLRISYMVLVFIRLPSVVAAELLRWGYIIKSFDDCKHYLQLF
jgi:hypothetical protein